jgi:hypothetical protein
MKYVKTALFVLVASFSALPARPSTLQLSIEHHIAVTSVGGKQAVLRTVFTDEPIVANVLLDVYALSQMPSTSVHLSDLQRLTPKHRFHVHPNEPLSILAAWHRAITPSA